MNFSLAAKASAMALSLMDGIGPIRAKKLIHYCGSPEEVFTAKPEALAAIPGMQSAVLNQLKDPSFLRRAEAEMDLATKRGWQVHYFKDSAYPWRMGHCEDGPLLLFQKGNTNLNLPRTLAIVGTRQMSDYGRDFLAVFTRDLQSLGLQVFSGLAYGVDAQAHRGCLENGIVNSAVLAHGLDRIYPYSNRKLAEEIIDKGGSWLSEFPSDTNPDRENFPKRNRIIAALSDAVLVVEAARKGGALITAGIANSYNRDVFALPGRFYDEKSEGCNLLIKSQRAHLLEGVSDLSYIMRWEENNPIKRKVQLELFQNLNPQEANLVQALSNAKGGKMLDVLVVELKVSAAELLSTLMTLELKSVIETLPGPRYRLRS